jgi:hypothetical protein
MNAPSREQTEVYIKQAQASNPGPWIQHSLFAARAAEAIANHLPNLDADTAFVLGYLHDIGRRVGITDMRHILEGYYFLKSEGFEEAARICITHSFPIREFDSAFGSWDCSKEELGFIKGYLSTVKYDDYDRLIQLCDAVALPSGCCLMEKRLINVALRYGVNEYCVRRWKAYLNIQADFEKVIGCSIYKLLPDVIEGTFGFK